MYWITLVAYRAFSGLQNGGEYKGSFLTSLGATACMLLLLGFSVSFLAPDTWPRIALGVAALSAIGLLISFETKRGYRWIHLLETITTSFVFIALFYYAPIFAILSVYPGLFLHKTIMNLVQDLPWDYWATDDSTGKTWGIPIPKWLEGKKFLWYTFPEDKIKIKRMSFKGRLVLTTLSILGVFAWKAVLTMPDFANKYYTFLDKIQFLS